MQPVPPPERRTRAGRNLPAAIGVGARPGRGSSCCRCTSGSPPSSASSSSPSCSRVCELSNAFGADRVRVPVVPRRRRRGGDRRVGVRRRQRGDGRRPGADRAGGHALAGCRRTRRATSATSPPATFAAAVRAVPGRLRGAAAPTRTTAPTGSSSSSLLVVLSDTGGYVAGVLFGKHPMAPTRQPEEVLGGLRRLGAVLRRRRCGDRCRSCSTARSGRAC